jgi:DNA-directed RNA polymerase specialized sigma24 family protein
MAMVWQTELFPTATDAEVQRTKFLLDKTLQMKSLITEFERFEEEMRMVAVDGEVARRIDAEDLHADKTANAAILAEKQRWVNEQYKFYTRQLLRAVALIQNGEEREVVTLRYLKGYSFKEIVFHYMNRMSESTVRRNLKEGEKSVANSLKLFGFFEQDEAKF